MATPRIFIAPRVKCPVCLEGFTGLEINSKLYAAHKRENDRHVIEYVWAQGIKSDVKPHHYEVWHCPVCHYSALHGEFSLSSATGKHKARWSTYRQLPPAVQMKMRQLSGYLNLDPPWDETTVILLIALALWAHILVEEEQRSWMDLGRLYLRLAWLYRESPILTLQGEAVEDLRTPGQSEMKLACEAFASVLTKLNETLSQLQAAIQRRHRETGREVYASIIESIGQKVHTLAIPSRNLEQVMLRDLQNALPGTDGHGPVRPPMTGLAHLIAGLFPEFPVSEVQATVACVEAFDKGLRLGDGGDLGVDAQLNLITVNIRLLERIGDYRRGLRYLTDMSKMAFSERQDLSRRIREMEKQNQNPEGRRPLVRQLNSVSAVLQNLSTLRDQLAAALLEKEGEPGRQYLEEQGWLKSV